MIGAATPENPRFNLNDPLAWDSLGAQPASSGQRVNREIALTHSPWWRGVNLLATDVAKIHLHVLELKNGVQTKATTHPAYFLLRRKPNDFQCAFTFRRQLTGHALSHGNGYAYILRRGNGDPVELLPLDPEQTFPVRAAGVLHYVTKVDGEDRKIPAANVLHIKGFSYDGILGYSVIDKARESLGLGIGARKWQAIYFRNNGRPGVTLECPTSLTDKAKAELRESWERMHGGIENAHRTAILDRGLQAKAISFNPQDSAVIESREFDIREVANFLGLPPHKLGDKSRANYNTLEQENQDYLDESLDPLLVNWETEAWDKLLTEEEKADEQYEVLFARQAFVRANLTDRGNYYRTALGGAPWMKPNEVRAEEGLPPEETGEALGRPKNMDYGEGAEGDGGAEQQPAKSPAKGPGDGQPNPDQVEDTPPAREGMDSIELHPEPVVAAIKVPPELLGGLPSLPCPSLPHPLAAALREAVGRMTRRVCLDAKRRARDPKTFLDWLTPPAPAPGSSWAVIDKHAPVLREALAPFAGAAAGWLLESIRAELLALCDRVTPGQLHQAVIDLAAALAERLPAAAIAKFLEVTP